MSDPIRPLLDRPTASFPIQIPCLLLQAEKREGSSQISLLLLPRIMAEYLQLPVFSAINMREGKKESRLPPLSLEEEEENGRKRRREEV